MPSTLSQIAQKLLTPGKGILASDERIESLNKKFAALGIAQTSELRRAYRELFIGTEDLEKYINGIILSEETIQQQSSNGMPFTYVLQHKGILIGAKVDLGTVDLAGFPGEKVTEGLDGLKGKIEFVKSLGATFTKWRAVIRIGDGLPSQTVLRANAQILARYAAIAQNVGVTPIIEPEILMEGKHSQDRAEEVTIEALIAVFKAVDEFRVQREELILKTSMVLPGNEFGEKSSPEQVAEYTIRALKQAVPEDVPGIVFLSGGQSPEEATANLNAIAQKEPLPWQISFSFLRALEQPALESWGGDNSNYNLAREVFRQRLELEVAAELGKSTSSSPES